MKRFETGDRVRIVGNVYMDGNQSDHHGGTGTIAEPPFKERGGYWVTLDGRIDKLFFVAPELEKIA